MLTQRILYVIFVAKPVIFVRCTRFIIFCAIICISCISKVKFSDFIVSVFA